MKAWLQSNALALTAMAWCITLALYEFDSRWIYDLSKWGLCASAALLAWKAVGTPRKAALAVAAVLFNPIARIHFDADEWIVVDWIAAGVFVATLPVEWRHRAKSCRSWAASHSPMLLVVGLIGFFVFFGIMVNKETAQRERDRPAREAAAKAKKDAEMDRIMNTLDPGREERAQKKIWREQESKSAELRARLDSHPSFYETPPK